MGLEAVRIVALVAENWRVSGSPDTPSQASRTWLGVPLLTRSGTVKAMLVPVRFTEAQSHVHVVGHLIGGVAGGGEIGLIHCGLAGGRLDRKRECGADDQNKNSDDRHGGDHLDQRERGFFWAQLAHEPVAFPVLALTVIVFW